MKKGSAKGALKRWSEMTALTRNYRARTWGMEWHWQSAISQGNGAKNGKNQSNIGKNAISRRNWFEVRANEKIQE